MNFCAIRKWRESSDEHSNISCVALLIDTTSDEKHQTIHCTLRWFAWLISLEIILMPLESTWQLCAIRERPIGFNARQLSDYGLRHRGTNVSWWNAVDSSAWHFAKSREKCHSVTPLIVTDGWQFSIEREIFQYLPAPGRQLCPFGWIGDWFEVSTITIGNWLKSSLWDDLCRWDCDRLDVLCVFKSDSSLNASNIVTWHNELSFHVIRDLCSEVARETRLASHRKIMRNGNLIKTF